MRLCSGFAASLLAAASVLPVGAYAQTSVPEGQEPAASCASEARFPTLDDATGKWFGEIDTEAAIAVCRQALELDPGDSASRANLARALVRAERIEEGLAELRIAAEAGSAQAQRQLAIRLEEAGGEANRREAIALLRRAVLAGYIPAMLTLAQDLTDESSPERNESEAFALATRGHEAGDSDLTNQLGIFYENGIGTPVNLTRATEMFRLAAEAGNAVAMHNYARNLRDGTGVASDMAGHVQWLERAVEAGETTAYRTLGEAYANGHGVERDDERALALFRQGDEAGDLDATVMLGIMYWNGRGLAERDPGAAFEFYRRAAEGGSSFGMLNLGRSYEFAYGTTRDYSLALEWYRRAAEGGQLDAYLDIGDAYKKGLGVPADLAQAVSWYERGRERGCLPCTVALGVLYSTGLGLERNQAKADQLFLEAAELGNAHAMRNVSMAYNAGRLGPDKAAGIEWARRAAETGGAHYEREFGRSLAIGSNGFEIDLPEARRWLSSALSKGEREAGPFLLLAILMDRSLANREELAADLLLEQAGHGEGWALASLAHPGPALAQLGNLPSSRAWQGKLDQVQSAEVLLTAADAFKDGLTAQQDLGRALELTRRAAAYDLLNARGHELEMLISLSLYSVALRRYDEFTTSAEYLALPEAQRTSFERRFITELETCFRSAEGATDTLEVMAGRGIGQAAQALGDFYNNKDNPEYAPASARYWYGQAIELGMTRPLAPLGYLHSFGIGGPQDEAKAFELYLRAAEAGYPGAQHNVAVMYDEGRGTQKDEAESVRWLELAAAGGSRSSLARLAVNRFKGAGTPADPEAAIAALEEAVEDLDGTSVWLMGIAHFEGAGVPRDVALGLRFLHLLDGIDHNAFSAVQLAYAYAGAWNVPPDPGQASHWLREARARGSQWASEALAACEDVAGGEISTGCIREVEGFEPRVLMEHPVATRVPLATLSDREDQLVADRNQALLSGDGVGAANAFEALNVLYRLYDEPERLLVNNALDIISTEARTIGFNGSRENYFSYITASCTWSSASESASAAGRNEAAVLFAKVAVNRLQQARGFIADLDDDLRECFIEIHRDRYRELAGRFLDLGRFEEAQNVLGMLKDFELQSYTGDFGDRGQAYAPMPMTAAQLRVVENFENALAVYNGNVNDPRFAPAFDAFATSLFTLEDAAQEDRASGSGIGGQDIQALLRDSGRTDIAAVQAVVQPDQIYWIVTGPAAQKVVRVPITLSEMTRSIRDYHESLALAEDGLEEPAGELYRMLFAPVDEELRALGASEVLLSLDENLRYLPFAALHDGDGWLVERYAFANFRRPDEIAARADDPAVTRVAGFGITKASSGFSALPMVENEIASIVIDSEADSGVLPGSARLDDQFDRDSLERAAQAHNGVIHIASHFALDPVGRDRSFLLLGGGEVLHLADFGGDRGITFEGAPMVVLSACETAVETRDASGVELDSLARIVGKAGASTVLASLWQVSDASTANLMTGFYRERFLHSLTNARSLRKAQLELIEAGRRGETAAQEGEDASEFATFDNPFFWAPFVVTADLVAS